MTVKLRKLNWLGHMLRKNDDSVAEMQSHSRKKNDDRTRMDI